MFFDVLILSWNIKLYRCAWYFKLILKDLEISSHRLWNNFGACEPHSNIFVFDFADRKLLIKLSKDFHHMWNSLWLYFLPCVHNYGPKSPILLNFKYDLYRSSLFIILDRILNQIEDYKLIFCPIDHYFLCYFIIDLNLNIPILDIAQKGL